MHGDGLDGRERVLHTVVEFVDEEQEMLLRPLGVGDVDVAAGIAEEGPGIVEAWHAFATQPAYLAVAIHHPDLRPHGKTLGKGLGELGRERRLVVRMDDRLPPAGRQRAGGFSEQMVEMQVGEADLAKLVGHPDQCGGRIRHVPEPRLALAQGREPALRLGERRIALFASRAQAQRCVRQNVRRGGGSRGSAR